MTEFHDFFSSYFTKTDIDSLKIDKLFGQASARQYFRITTSNQKTYVLMKIPGGFSSPAEEITKIQSDAPKEFPFLNICKYLHNLELPVPEIFHVDEKAGLILLQDLGDESFESLIQNLPKDYALLYYRKVLDELIHLQTQTAKNPAQDCVAYYRKFDADLLNWEFDHFLEYGIKDRLNLEVSLEHANSFQSITRQITKNILAMPQGFVHRDFQSRNIMFCDMDFYLIDFQDALVGPVLYDVVALLRDSYIELSGDDVENLLSYYGASLPKEHPYAGKGSQLFEDFYQITLQRKLKDAGRFQYIKTVRNNPDFLKHIPLTLAFIKEALKKSSFGESLQKTLSPYVKEFR